MMEKRRSKQKDMFGSTNQKEVFSSSNQNYHDAQKGSFSETMGNLDGIKHSKTCDLQRQEEPEQ